MKFLSVILSFLILAMVMMPCQEETEMENDGIELTSNSTTENHDAPEDNCNAFCHCARCPFSVVLTETNPLIANENSSVIYDGDHSPAIEKVSFGIWQPPKSA